MHILRHIITTSLLVLLSITPLYAQSLETRRLQTEHDRSMQKLVDERFTQSMKQQAEQNAEITKRHNADRPPRIDSPEITAHLQEREALRQMCKTFPGGSCDHVPSLRVTCTQHTSGSHGNYTSTMYCY